MPQKQEVHSAYRSVQKVDDAVINLVPADDYVEIMKATLKPVVYSKRELNDVVYIILKALQDVSKVRYYGITMLVDILRGADRKRIFDQKLDKVSEFGALKDMPRETIQSIVEWLIREHYILKTKGKYPVLHSTYEGLHYSESMTESRLKKLKKYLDEEVVLWK